MDRRAGAAGFSGLALIATLAFVTPTDAQQSGAIYTQCPGDTNGDGIPDVVDPAHPNVKCMHLAAGDGFVTMADGKPLYTFGFKDVTGIPPSQVVNAGLAAANFPAPTIRLKEGQEFYLSLTNVGMVLRPDLFDEHSVHFHGFAQAASVFDGVPESSATVRMGATFTYYYKLKNDMDAGTYMYHCHVEATEHMAMGMLGNLYVEPKQNDLPNGTMLGSFMHTTGQKYAYNDGDGSTAYDVEKEIQISSFDSNFHDQHITIQPLPFFALKDDYPMLNGRGYPDTTNPAVISTDAGFGNLPSQPVNTIVEATAGQKVLLRISNLSITRFYTLGSTIPMKVIGHSARNMKGPGPKLTAAKLYYDTNSVTLGGGESIDVILNTAGVAPGTYLLYSTNLNYLSNGGQDFGGMMTEIVIH